MMTERLLGGGGGTGGFGEADFGETGGGVTVFFF